MASYSRKKNSSTYVMYHGTSAENAKSIKKHGFRRSTDDECSTCYMAHYYPNFWAEVDGTGFTPPCLESFTTPQKDKVYLMYHGTSAENAKIIQLQGFRQSNEGMLGHGVYVSRDIEKASRYPLYLCESQKVVLQVYVNVGRVKKIDYQGHPLQKTWHQNGYDTAWCPPLCGMVQSGLEEDCVWDPRRIKLVGIIPPKKLCSQWFFSE
ncbi:grass carp reovirus (GCRV)-induced gene 2p isoform X2 [Narcine bancroftii]|uniref:grass carp reovirus (GCRV)-induced gene 2p isoform X2 n=1 Tax=Narcine bancroftii TaxID=1343680 RepID=UPI003832019C